MHPLVITFGRFILVIALLVVAALIFADKVAATGSFDVSPATGGQLFLVVFVALTILISGLRRKKEN